MDALVGWFVGEKGAIYYTSDGGDSWVRQHSGVDVSLGGLYFVNRFKGWVTGGEQAKKGVILYTSDGGLNWIKQVSDPERAFGSIIFVDSLRGWIGGTMGTILHTKTGGVSLSELEERKTADSEDLEVNYQTGLIKIRYWVNEPSGVRMGIYSLLGEEVKRCFEGFVMSGRQEEAIETEGISSGIYFILLDKIKEKPLIKPVVIQR